MVEQSAVNRLVVGSNPTWGEFCNFNVESLRKEFFFYNHGSKVEVFIFLNKIRALQFPLINKVDHWVQRKIKYIIFFIFLFLPLEEIKR